MTSVVVLRLINSLVYKLNLFKAWSSRQNQDYFSLQLRYNLVLPSSLNRIRNRVQPLTSQALHDRAKTCNAFWQRGVVLKWEIQPFPITVSKKKTSSRRSGMFKILYYSKITISKFWFHKHFNVNWVYTSLESYTVRKTVKNSMPHIWIWKKSYIQHQRKLGFHIEIV